MPKKYSTNIVTQFTQNVISEALTVTASVCSGTYPGPESVLSNIKNDTLGYFQTLHDYPYLSQSSSPVLDFTFGFREGGSIGASSLAPKAGTSTDILAKQNIYKQMAGLILGYDSTGSVRHFDLSGSFDTVNADTVMNCPVFINLSRLVNKDQLKKGSFSMKFDTGAYISASQDFATKVTITDSGSADLENGLRFLKSSNQNVGLLDRYRGIAIIQLSGSKQSAILSDDTVGYFVSASVQTYTGGNGDRAWNFEHSVASGTILEIGDAMRHRIQEVSVQNQTQLNVATYYCTANANEFNYSTNPTYVDSNSKVRVRLDAADGSVNPANKAFAYITGVGLYSADNELLAVAKISRPVKKDESAPFTLGVKLTY